MRVIGESKTAISSLIETEMCNHFQVANPSPTVNINDIMAFCYITSNPDIIVIECEGKQRYFNISNLQSFIRKNEYLHQMMQNGINPFHTKGF